MSIVIDELEIQVKKQTTDAASSLDALTKSFNRLNNALGKTGKGGVTGLERLQSSIHSLNHVLGQLDDAKIAKVEKLANAMSKLSTVAKGMNGLSSATAKVQKAMDNMDKVQSASKKTTEGGTTSVTKLQEVGNAWKRFGETMATTFEKTKKNQSIFDKLLKSIGRVALYRAIRTVISSITNSVSEGLANAYEFSKVMGGELYEKMNKVASLNAQFKNQLGSMVSEIVINLLPAIEDLLNKAIDVTNYLSQVFAAWNGDTQYKQAQYIALEWDNASASVKKYKQQLLGLDELNNLSSGNSNGKTSASASDAFVYADIDRVDVSKIESAKAKLLEFKESLGWDGQKSVVANVIDDIDRFKTSWDNSKIKDIVLWIDENIFTDSEGNARTQFDIGAEAAENLLSVWTNVKTKLDKVKVSWKTLFNKSGQDKYGEKTEKRTTKWYDTITQTILKIATFTTLDWRTIFACDSLDDVVDEVTKRVLDIEEALGYDINGDGIIGYRKSESAVSVGTKQLSNIDDYFTSGSINTKGAFDVGSYNLQKNAISNFPISSDLTPAAADNTGLGSLVYNAMTRAINENLASGDDVVALVNKKNKQISNMTGTTNYAY